MTPRHESENEPDSDENGPSRVPDAIRTYVEEYGIHVPQPILDRHQDDPTRLVYENMLKGHCIACGAQLQEDTVAFITKLGVTMLFCSGVCTNDYQIMGWLSEKYDDMVQAMTFRTQGSPTSEEGKDA